MSVYLAQQFKFLSTTKLYFFTYNIQFAAPWTSSTTRQRLPQQLHTWQKVPSTKIGVLDGIRKGHNVLCFRLIDLMPSSKCCFPICNPHRNDRLSFTIHVVHRWKDSDVCGASTGANWLWTARLHSTNWTVALLTAVTSPWMVAVLWVLFPAWPCEPPRRTGCHDQSPSVSEGSTAQSVTTTDSSTVISRLMSDPANEFFG